MSRIPIVRKCRLCGKDFNSQEMRMHEPGCRRKKLLKVGALFHASVVARGEGKMVKRVVPVRIEELNDDGSILVTNMMTRRTTTLKSPRRLREWMELAHSRNTGRRLKAEARAAARTGSGE
jgi:hypothetical protein